jgi:hypothetical protein
VTRDPLRRHPDDVDRRPPPGWDALLLAAVIIGVLLMGIQLWLLTVALDIYLGGEESGLWIIAVFSGLVFAGGLVALRMVGERWSTRARR